MKYVHMRRHFTFVDHSLFECTQYVLFEPMQG